MDFRDQVVLGKTGVRVGRLGISSSYGAPAQAFEEAFERGANYFTWGTFIKGRSPHMRTAIRNLIGQGLRDKLVLAMWSYAHNGPLMEHFLRKGLRQLGTDHTDVLLMGYHTRRPSQRLIDRALELKAQGIVRFLGLSSHNRRIFPVLAQEGLFDLFHVRYNAAHRGAETEVFPKIAGEGKPGIVSFTATRWGRLLDPKRMPPGETTPTAADCYRFVLTNPAVNVCMVGTRNLDQMREALAVLEMGPMDEGELSRMHRIGDHLHRRHRP